MILQKKNLLHFIIFLLIPSVARAATCYWVGSSGGNWNVAANWSSSSGGAGSTCNPDGTANDWPYLTADIANFSSGNTNNATINISISIASINLQTGYTGTVTQSGSSTITLTGSYSQVAGAFLGGSGNIDINNGNFSLTGGTFTNTTGILSVERNFTVNGGTFDGTNGGSNTTITIDGDSSLDVSTFKCSNTFNSSDNTSPTVNISKAHASADYTLGNNVGQTCTLYADLTSNQGPVTINATDTLVSSSTSFNLANAACGGIVINGTLTLQNNSTITTNNNFTNSGTINNLSTATLIFKNIGPSYTATYTNTSPVKNMTLNSTAATSHFVLGSNATITNSFTRTDGPVDNPGSAYTLYVGGDFSVSTTDAFGGSNMTVELNGSGNQNISQSSTTISTPFKINKSGGDALISSASLTISATTTITEGIFHLNGKSFTSTGTFTVEDGGVLALQGGESPTIPTLNENSTVQYTGDGDAGSDTYTLKNWTYQNLAIGSTNSVTIDSNDTFNPAAALDINGGFSLTGGVLDLTATPYNMAVAGNWSKSGGTFTPQTGTVTFDTTGTTTVSGNTTFYRFASTTANKPIIFTAGSTQTISNLLTLTGSSGNPIVLTSSSPGTNWLINNTGTHSVDYVSVRDASACDYTTITATNSTNVSNNKNWDFGSGATSCTATKRIIILE